MIHTSMLAAVFEKPGKIMTSQVAVRLPGPDEILVQIAACGVCGTDRHIYQGDPGAADSPPGTILGHEMAGTIAAIGSAVTDLSVGDRVAIDPNDYCGSCPSCRSGQVHFCSRMTGIGTTVNGGFAEYCTCRAKQAYKLPEHVSFTVAAMAEPIACCLHGLDLARVDSGMHVLIIGAGTIGQLMLQLAYLHGAAAVAVIEPVAAKRELAAKMGASICLEPGTPALREKLNEAGFSHINLVIECAGLPATCEQAIDLAGQGASVLLFGLTAQDSTITVKPFQLFQRELKIMGSFINPCTMGRAIALLGDSRLQIEPLISQQIALADIEQVFTRPELGKQGKILITTT